MLNVSPQSIEEQLYADDFLDAFDRLAPDHVPSGAARKTHITRLRISMEEVYRQHSPKSVDEWVELTAAHYAEVSRSIAEYAEEQREHMLTGHEYGLSQRAA